MFGSQITAQAQVSSSYGATYEYGTPTMVAAAPSLPAVRAEQIAQDVTTEYNPRTGRTEFVAAPFDPFEQDPGMAGSLKLRSADGSVAIDGQRLQGGAIVDVDFYYNSPSDDPYGGRNYGDASFVNGQLAPVVTRDSRVLECSTRVENVVYDHASYYTRSPRVGIYRPYRHYAGHSGFGYGFGSGYFGPGYNYYDRNRGNYSRIRGHLRTPRLVRGLLSDYRDGRRDRDRRGDGDRNRDRDGDRNRDGDRDRDGDRNRDRDRNGDRRDGRGDTGNTPRSNSRGLTAQQRENRLRAMQLHGSALALSGAVRRNGRSTLSSAVPGERVVIGTGSSQTQTQSRTPKIAPLVSRSDLKNPERRAQSRRAGTARQATPSRTDTTRTIVGRAATAAREANRGTTVRAGQGRASQPSTSRASTPRPTTTRASTPKESSSRSSRSRPSGSRASTSRDSSSSSRSSSSRSSSSRTTKSRASSPRSAPSRSFSRRSSRKLNFFPASAQGGRQVVTSRSVDCAREDKLRVFVSNERLEAARFDGLTLIALDAQGGETPIYIPPNYIEGFRLAASGRIRPQGYQSHNNGTHGYQTQGYQTQGSQSQGSQSQGYQSRQPYSGVPVQVQPPARAIEAAPCPTGTSKQPDGTCLQNTVSGYPYR